MQHLIKKLTSSFFVFFAVWGCNPTKNGKTLISYSLFSKENKILLKNVVKLQKFYIGIKDSVFIKNDLKVDSFSFIEYIKPNDGIYRMFQNKWIKAYSFSNRRTYPAFYNGIFFMDSIFLVDKKKYKIYNKLYMVYHFHEYSRESGRYESYYLKDFGFIGYYNLWYDSTLLVTSEEPSTISAIDLNNLENCLVRDSSFFGRYTLIKNSEINRHIKGKGAFYIKR